jgi:copper homeostasis protein
MKSDFLLEVCVDSMASALAAREGGADRLELCSSLSDGGLTPSAGMIEVTRKHLHIAINVMIRPRAGDFLYSELELAIMQRDIELAKSLGANGVVFGVLTAEGQVDLGRNRQLIEAARPLSATFHRAFDMVADPAAALEALITLGFDRVLTSGLKATATQGVETITALVRQAAGRIIVMPGSGVSESNIAELRRLTGASEFHMSGLIPQESVMSFRNPHIALSASAPTPEYGQQVTSAQRVRAAVVALNGAKNYS